MSIDGLGLPAPDANEPAKEGEKTENPTVESSSPAPVEQVNQQNSEQSNAEQPAPTQESAPATTDVTSTSDSPLVVGDQNAGQVATTEDSAVLTVNESAPLTPEQVRQQNIDKLLSRMAPVGTKANFKILIYGPPGGTKSSFLNIPNCLVYDQEGGLISIKSWCKQSGQPVAENLQSIPFTSFAQADFLLDNLTNKIPELDFVKVFAIDTMNDFHRKALMNEVVAKAHRNAPTSVSRWVPQTEHHQENNEKMLDFVRRIRDLDRDVVLLAHSKTVEPKGKPAKTYPDFSESMANKIEAMMDLVGYMEMVEANGEHFPVMRVAADAGIHAKTRVPLPALIKNPTYAQLRKAWEDLVES